MRLWVVIPALNEAARIEAAVRQVIGKAAGCIVADGGSGDGTMALATQSGASVVSSAPGRAIQMNCGAWAALARDPTCDHLLFLHADCVLPHDWIDQLAHARGSAARFDVELISSRLSGWRWHMLRMIAWFMNQRSAITGICTGDQALFVPVAAFRMLNGFAAIPLMEDIDMSRRLKRLSMKPIRLRGPIQVSARRWEERGVIQTMLAMFEYRLRYFVGESPESLHRRYYGP